MKRVRPGDWIAAVLIFTLATGIWAAGRSQSSGSLTALVRQDGQVVRTIALTGLSEPITFTLDGAYTNTIRAENGRICVESATCPGQDCVHTGWLTRAGQSAVCLENRVSITLEGAATLDAIAR
ncbi:MAG TPA: NusG domain II-containing protein [Firmicutes bacterium]|nr:NusG domain II-containing protein [Bacillota bacterium]